MQLLAGGEAEGETRRDQLLEPAGRVLHWLGLAVALFDTSLLCGHRLFHNKVIEVSSRIDGSLLVKTALLHVIVHFVDQLFAHVEQLRTTHSVVAIVQIGGLV